jgi:hypothetical protein
MLPIIGTHTRRACPFSRRRWAWRFDSQRELPQREVTTALGGANIMSKAYSVWVNGNEVNDFALTNYSLAEQVAQIWVSMGYEDIQIKEIPKA